MLNDVGDSEANFQAVIIIFVSTSVTAHTRPLIYDIGPCWPTCEKTRDTIASWKRILITVFSRLVNGGGAAVYWILQKSAVETSSPNSILTRSENRKWNYLHWIYYKVITLQYILTTDAIKYIFPKTKARIKDRFREDVLGTGSNPFLISLSVTFQIDRDRMEILNNWHN